MSREIKFRGRTPKGQWVYGCFIHTGCDAPGIVWGDGEQAEIDPETLGQFTALKDKNGTDIYEGDIVKSIINMIFDKGTHNRKVIFSKGIFYCGPTPLDNIVTSFKAEIIGNIHENPELLEKP